MFKKINWFEGFSLDLRSLALFRILFGSCLFLDVFYRLFYIEEFYSDRGVLPRDAIIGRFMSAWESSLYFANGQYVFSFLLMLVTLLCLVAFIVGYRTRLATFLTWVLILSLQVRAQIVLHGGDDLIRVLLFWCQFVPLGAEFSVDRALHPHAKRKSYELLSFGTAGLVLQLMFMYLFTAALKWHPVWHTEGSAIYYALSLEQFTTFVGNWLVQFLAFLKVMTFITLAFEFIGPVLVLLPWFAPRTRTWVALSFIFFHLGLAICLHLAFFPWTCIAAWCMVFPASFWDKVSLPTKVFTQMALMVRKWNWPLPAAPQVHLSRFLQLIALLFLFLITFWNFSHHESFAYKPTEIYRIVMNITGTYQKWNMFAPYPRKDDGWYVVEGTLVNGEKVNPFTSDFIYSEDKPADMASTYKNTMWRKYLTNSWLKSYHGYRLYFGKYLCRTWNENHSEADRKLDTLKIYYMMELNNPPGEEAEPVKKELLWRHYCVKKPKDWDE